MIEYNFQSENGAPLHYGETTLRGVRVSVCAERSALTRCLKDRVTEEGWLRCSRALPKGAALGGNRDSAKKRRNHAAGQRPIGGQGEIQLRARARPEGEEASERAFRVEQPATTGARIEGGRGPDYLAAIVGIEAFHDAVADREIASAGKTDRSDTFSDLQRRGTTDRDRRQIKVGHAHEAKIVNQAAGLNGGAPTPVAVADLDRLRFARDVTGSGEQVGCDDHSRPIAHGAVCGDRANLDETVSEVARAQWATQNACQQSGDERWQPNRETPMTSDASHGRRYCRKQAIDDRGGTSGPRSLLTHCSARENPAGSAGRGQRQRDKRATPCTKNGRAAGRRHRSGAA